MTPRMPTVTLVLDRQRADLPQRMFPAAWHPIEGVLEALELAVAEAMRVMALSGAVSVVVQARGGVGGFVRSVPLARRMEPLWMVADV